MNTIFDIPLWITGPLLVLGSSVFSLVAMVVIRRSVLPRFQVKGDDIVYTATIITSVMVLYGLIAALIAITVWEKHTAVEDQVAAEVTAIASLWRDLGGYPSPVREDLRGQLRRYTEYTIHDAWGKMRKGIVPTAGIEMIDRFQDRLFAFEPTTESQKLLHAETLRAFNNMLLERRLRLNAVLIGLPGVIWWLILSGAVICIVVSLLHQLQDARYQALMVVSLAAFVAMVIFAILAFDRPFRGTLGIQPEGLELIHDQLMMH